MSTMSRGQPTGGLHGTQGRAHRSRPHPARSIAALAAAAGLLLVLLGAGLTIRAAAARGRPRPARAAAGLLILWPRTFTQVAHAGALRLELTASPLVPGPNHLVVTLAENGRAVAGAQVRLRVTMVGMIMRPVMLTAGDSGRGHYSAVAPLPMFGPWQLTVRVQRRHRAPLARAFGVTLALPVNAAREPTAGTTTRR